MKEIRTIFHTLLLQKGVRQQDLANYLNLDKSYISRVVNGIYEPDLTTKLKIASFFGVDTSVIWRKKWEVLK